jgi:hypothetical protein
VSGAKIHPASLANLRLGKPKQQANAAELRQAIRQLLEAHKGARALAKRICCELHSEMINRSSTLPSLRTVQWHIRAIRLERSESHAGRTSPIAQIVGTGDAMADARTLCHSTTEIGSMSQEPHAQGTPSGHDQAA